MSCSLFELNEFIRRVLALNFGEALWVRCELAQVKFSKGHCFLSLVEKAQGSDDIIAQGEAVIWQRDYKKLQRTLGLQLPALLQEGLEILMLAKVEYHERYGLKLQIEDLDPAYTLGKLEMKRRETIAQLQKAGLLDKNSRLPLPHVLQKIAILTSEGAAGFQDFKNHLSQNPFAYRFDCEVFVIAVQGVDVERDVLAQLQKIASQPARFDAVVVIRGGGSKLDLAAFDSLELCRAVAQFPLPIITGIGHEVDETIADMVAHTSLKTPTAVADFLIFHNLRFESAVEEQGQLLKSLAATMLTSHELRLNNLWQLIDFQAKTNVQKQTMMLDFIEKELPNLTKNRLAKEHLALDNHEKTIHLLSPETALKRGFSIVTKNGKAITNAQQTAPGDQLEIILHKGKINTIVKRDEE